MLLSEAEAPCAWLCGGTRKMREMRAQEEVRAEEGAGSRGVRAEKGARR